MRLLAGADDLVIDDGLQTVVLPVTFGRKHRVTLNFNSIRAVNIESIRRRQRGGYYFTWAVVLANQNESDAAAKLLDWRSEKRAIAFAKWLRERLHLPEAVDEPADADNTASSSSSIQ
jgi:hypothetical protein